MRKLLLGVCLVCMVAQVYAAKDITIKGILLPSTSLFVQGTSEWNDEVNPQVSWKNKYTESYKPNLGLGLGVEYAILNADHNYGLEFWPKKTELLTGFTYGLPQSISNYELTQKISAPKINHSEKIKSTNNLDDGGLAIQITSLYLKPRYFFANLYAGFKLSYNLMNVSGENPEGLSLANSVGYGLALGYLLDDTWDIELAYDTIGTIASGVTAEQYQISNILLSVGYRFDPNTSTRPPVKKIERLAPTVRETPVVEPEQPKYTPVIEEPIMVREEMPVEIEVEVVEEEIMPVSEEEPIVEPETVVIEEEVPETTEFAEYDNLLNLY